MTKKSERSAKLAAAINALTPSMENFPQEVALDFSTIANVMQRKSGITTPNQSQARTLLKPLFDLADTMLTNDYGITIIKVNDRLFGGSFDVEGRTKRARRARKREVVIDEDPFHFWEIFYSGATQDLEAEWIRSCLPIKNHLAIGIVAVRPTVVSPFVQMKLQRRVADWNIRKANTSLLEGGYEDSGKLGRKELPSPT